MAIHSLLRRTFVALALLTTAALAARAEVPAVLSQVPADAYAVLTVSNVRTFGLKLSNAATRLDIPVPPDPVGAATRSLGITAGFDANSSAAIVLLKPAAGHENENYFAQQPPAVLLLPTSDAPAMLKPLSPTPPDAAGISEVTLAADPGKGFVANVADKWVAFAIKHEDLEAYLARKGALDKTLTPESIKAFENNDIVLWANVTRLSAGLDEAITGAESELTGMLDLQNMAAGQDPLAGALQRQFVSIFFNGARQFLKDADSVTLAARLTDSGATLGLTASFKPDSASGRFVAAQKTAQPASLQGLPDGNFIVAGAMSWDPASFTKLFDQVAERIVNDKTLATDPRTADLRDYLSLTSQAMALTQGMKVVILDPPAGGNNGFINGAAIVETSDPAKLMAFQQQLMKSNFLQNAASMNPDIKQTITSTPDAVTVRNVKLTKTIIKFTLRDETPDKPLNPASRMIMPIFQRIYGPDGLTTYTGIAGKRVVVIYGSDATIIESAVAAALSDSDSLAKSPAIAGTKDQIIANPLGVAYLPVTRWIALAQSLIMPGAGPMPAAITNAPPVIISAGTSNTTITGELHVPLTTMIGIRDAVVRLQGAGAGGGAGGAGPILP